MRLYIPIDVFNRDDIKALYISLGPKLIKDISSQLNRYFDLCQTISISKEFKHNKYIQQKYFNSKLDGNSSPLYISKTNRVHISKRHSGANYLKLLDITIDNATTPEQIVALFQIISISFWADFTAYNLLPWIDKNYKTLIDSGMRITRIPFIPNIDRYTSLTSLGKIDAQMGTYIYCIWEGPVAELQRNLISIKRVIEAHRTITGTIEVHKESMEIINRQIALIDTHLSKQKSAAVMEPTSYHSDNNINTFAEELITKLGRKDAAALAQAIMSKLLE